MRETDPYEAPAALSWAPGQQCVVARGDSALSQVGAEAPERWFLKLFFQGHLYFMNDSPPAARSRWYMGSILESLQDLPPDSRHGQDMRDAHAVWSFVHALYFVDPAVDSTHVSYRLADWFTQNFSDLHARGSDMVKNQGSSVSPDQCAEFWQMVTRLAAVGSRKLARELILSRRERSTRGREWAGARAASTLGREVSGDMASLRDVDLAARVLDACPAFEDTSIAGRSDGSWTQWQDRCLEWAEARDGDEEPGLVQFLRVLGGSTADLAAVCTNWEEMIVAVTTYGRRLLTESRDDHAIVEVEYACSEASRNFSMPEIAGGALVDAASGRPADMLRRMETSLHSRWYAAHLCDLLLQAGRLSSEPLSGGPNVESGCEMLERLILDFCRSVEFNRGTWRLVADYYAQCPSSGEIALTDLLNTVPFAGPTDPWIEKVLTFCDKNKTKMVKERLCLRVGTECMHSKNFGGAAYWFARGELRTEVTTAVEGAIASAESTGFDEDSSRVLLHTATAATIATTSDAVHDQVAFCFDYAKLVEAVAIVKGTSSHDTDAELGAWMQVIEDCTMRLICGGGLPRRFWAIVVYEICNLLKTRPNIGGYLGIDAFHELLSAVEVVSSSPRCDGSLDALCIRVHGATPAAEDRKDARFAASHALEDALEVMRRQLLESNTTAITSGFEDTLDFGGRPVYASG